MLRKHRGFLIFVTVVTTGGVAARLLWDATASHQEPPIWATLLAAVVIVLVAMSAEAWFDRRQISRSRRRTIQ